MRPIVSIRFTLIEFLLATFRERGTARWNIISCRRCRCRQIDQMMSMYNNRTGLALNEVDSVIAFRFFAGEKRTGLRGRYIVSLVGEPAMRCWACSIAPVDTISDGNVGVRGCVR